MGIYDCIRFVGHFPVDASSTYAKLHDASDRLTSTDAGAIPMVQFLRRTICGGSVVSYHRPFHRAGIRLWVELNAQMTMCLAMRPMGLEDLSSLKVITCLRLSMAESGLEVIRSCKFKF